MRILNMILTASLVVAVGILGCDGGVPSRAPLPSSRVTTDLTHLKDSQGRYVFLHGVNLSGSTKVPKSVDGKELKPTDLAIPYNNGDPSYVGKPWDDTGCTFDATGSYNPASEAVCEPAREIIKLRGVGFNVFRFLLNWEGIEHEGPGLYDYDYLNSIARQVKIAEHYGVYILLDMHQDSYSRHLVAMYNEKPSYKDENGNTVYPPRGSIENMILSLVPPYTDAVRGEGAPRWAVEKCLFEKHMDAETWGTPRLISGITDPNVNLSNIIDLLTKLLGEGGGGGPAIPPWVTELLTKVPNPAVPVTDTSDLLPFTNWGVMSMTSIDTARNFACLLSGFFGADDPYKRGGAYKDHFVKDGNGTQVPVSTYLQAAYAKMWRQVVISLKANNGGKVPANVIGYDIINEPNGNFITMTAAAAIFSTGFYQSAQDTLVNLLGKETGAQIFDTLTALRLLPILPAKPVEPIDPGTGATADEKALYDQAKADYPAAKTAYDAEIETVKHDWGFQYTDLFGVVGLNTGYDRNYMSPFYEVVGREIFEEDRDAVIWFEPAMSISSLISTSGGMWDTGMTKPHICRCEEPGSAMENKSVDCDDTSCKVINQADTIYEPHFYADIYPFIGFNQPSRDFTTEEVKYRDYDSGLQGNLNIVTWNLENVPAVYGEFGTYYNFGGIEKSFKEDFEVSSQILDNYYESLERMFMHRILWCYTPDNDPRYGDWWNKEDFSIWKGWKDADLDMDRDIGLAKPVVTTTAKAIAEGTFRCEKAWSRPYPRFMAGKPVSLHFFSPYHYFDPDKGEVPPEREFELVYEARETSAPTEIFVPAIQYPDSEGFYVWLSDGYASWDPATRVLYHYPVNDEPGARHWIRILPPLSERPSTGWQYYIRGSEVVARN